VVVVRESPPTVEKGQKGSHVPTLVSKGNRAYINVGGLLMWEAERDINELTARKKFWPIGGISTSSKKEGGGEGMRTLSILH